MKKNAFSEVSASKASSRQCVIYSGIGIAVLAIIALLTGAMG